MGCNTTIIGKDSLEKYILDSVNDDLSYKINESSNSKILFLLSTLKDININIDIEDNATIKMVFFVSSNYSYNLNINLKRDSQLELYTSDKNSGDSKIVKTINLLGENSSFKGYEFISSMNNKITGGFYVNHLSKKTTTDSKLNYLSNENGYINRDAVATIEKGMDNSNSSENIKGIILNNNSRIDSKPVLVISCDDVHASHGCAIGTIDDNEIYYLMSRGLSKEDSLKIICKSLINPILREINDDDFYSIIKPLIFSTIGE